MARRQDQRTARQTLTGDTTRVILMDMCQCELKHLHLFNSGSFDTCPTVKATIRDYVEKMSHTSDSWELANLLDVRKMCSKMSG